jgi:hypothetical protein
MEPRLRWVKLVDFGMAATCPAGNLGSADCPVFEGIGLNVIQAGKRYRITDALDGHDAAVQTIDQSPVRSPLPRASYMMVFSAS